ncbi:MAG: heavy metal translocating P-type ATPase [Sphaerochaetaceae bacterium]|jgi:Cd2+/Zn2+-exporting ATPase
MAHQYTYNIKGIDCAVCALHVEDAIKKVDGVVASSIDVATNTLIISSSFETNPHFEKLIKDTILKEEPEASITQKHASRDRDEHHHSDDHSHLLLLRLGASLTLLLIGSVITFEYSFILFILSYLLSGYDVVFRALRNIVRGKLFDEYFLMTIATFGAFIIGDYNEAVAVMAFYQAGEYVQHLAIRKSRASISSLIDVRPLSATVFRQGEFTQVHPSEIVVGDRLLIKAGEKVAVDAQVVSGNSFVDTKAITGESVPKGVTIDDHLLSGSINGSGVLEAVATTNYEDSTVATMLRLVEEASTKKAQTERFITTFARYYTPIVVFLALALALLPPLFNQGELTTWVYRSLVFLVISCPCALVISVPLGFFGGIGGLSRLGVLVKGGDVIQKLASVKTLFLDKTGTLTKGVFHVTHVEVNNTSLSEQEIIRYAASLEAHSHHPIASAITSSCELPLFQATEVSEISGKGITGKVDSHIIHIGSRLFIQDISDQEIASIEQQSSTVVYVAIDHHYIGALFLSDVMKEEAPEMMKELKALGVSTIGILSGDDHSSVNHVAARLGITTFEGNLLPHDKLFIVEKAIAQRKSKESVVFVGDGMNDSPVLALSDVGISMGGIGSDAAIESSDVVVMGDQLLHIPKAIRHSRYTMHIVKQNITLAIGIKIIVMILGAFGLASMWLAVFADTGVALLAILNSLRALKQR